MTLFALSSSLTTRWEDSYRLFCKTYGTLFSRWVTGFYLTFWDFLRNHMALNPMVVTHVRLCGYLVTYQSLATPGNRTSGEKTFSLGHFPGSLKTKKKEKTRWDCAWSNICFIFNSRALNKPPRMHQPVQDQACWEGKGWQFTLSREKPPTFHPATQLQNPNPERQLPPQTHSSLPPVSHRLVKQRTNGDLWEHLVHQFPKAPLIIYLLPLISAHGFGKKIFNQTKYGKYN